MTSGPVPGPVVVTGSSGRLGSELVRSLRRSGVEVRGVDRRAAPTTSDVVDLVSGDLGRPFDGASAVVHCAALHAPHLESVMAADFAAVNVAATERLLDIAARRGVRRFVFTSTTSVYGHAFGEGGVATWVDEAVEPRPRDIYDRTKLDAESAVADAHRNSTTDAMRTITLRIARCFPEPWPELVIHRLYRGVDVRDVVHGVTRALTADVRDHHVLNLGGPRVFEREDVAELYVDAGAVIARRLPGVTLGVTVPASIDRIYVSDRAGQVLGYAPERDVVALLADAPQERTKNSRTSGS